MINYALRIKGQEENENRRGAAGALGNFVTDMSDGTVPGAESAGPATSREQMLPRV